MNQGPFGIFSGPAPRVVSLTKRCSGYRFVRYVQAVHVHADGDLCARRRRRRCTAREAGRCEGSGEAATREAQPWHGKVEAGQGREAQEDTSRRRREARGGEGTGKNKEAQHKEEGE